VKITYTRLALSFLMSSYREDCFAMRNSDHYNSWFGEGTEDEEMLLYSVLK